MDAELVVLVTASSSGLGADMATGLARPGRHLIVHYHTDATGAAAVAEKIKRSGATATLVQADLTDPGAITKMTEKVRDANDRLDVLVNNFGPYVRNRWDAYTDDEWRLQIEGTVTAAHHVTRDLIDLLRAGDGGTIVNIADSAAELVAAHEPDLPYYVGKTGVVMLTRTIARAEASHGITANALMAGVMENSGIKPEVAHIPAGRFGTGEDLVGVIEFLIEARYVTGSAIQVGGGWNL